MFFKQHSITHRIPSCKFGIDDLVKLVALGNRVHNDCLEQFKRDVFSKTFTQVGLDISARDKAEAIINEQFRVMIEIFGDDGEYLNVLDLQEIPSEAEIPYKISKIRFGNASIYNFYFNNKPSTYFEVTIDFRTTKIFDLISSPTYSTSNDSLISVVGQNSTVANGISSTLEKYFRHHRARYGFIHAENIYDIVLWLFFFPLLLVYLFKFSSKIPDFVSQSPVIVQIVAALPAFFILLLTFRMAFNVGRWLFPYMEITTQTSWERTACKAIYSLIVTSLVGAIIVHFGTYFVDALVK